MGVQVPPPLPNIMAKRLVLPVTRNSIAWQILKIQEELQMLYQLPHMDKSARMEEQELIRRRDKLYDRLEPWFEKEYGDYYVREEN